MIYCTNNTCSTISDVVRDEKNRNVRSIMAVGGSVGGAFIVFIYPAAFYLKVVKRVDRKTLFCLHNAPQLAMIGIGSLAGLLCFFVSLTHALEGFREETLPVSPSGCYKL